ncbi:MAG: asparaginase [Saprospiraceae bacterium]|nr:asparaginase [Saprospiraceae bacterium]
MMQGQNKPKIIIITTGGTIASRVEAPMVAGHALVQAVPQLLDHAEIEVIEFSQIGSSKITPDHWLSLAKKINELFRNDANLSGIVVTHGTDSMEETAFFLHLTVKDRRPVILTGAMKTSDEVSADGPANLINAVRLAVDSAAIDQGVLLVMNENILSARDAWKTDNRRPETFQSTGFGYLGVVDPDRILFYRKLTHPHTLQTSFDIMQIHTLPRVELISDFTGFDATILDYFGTRNLDGFVFQSFAGGRLSKGAEEGLHRLTKKIPVVIASKVPQGRIIGNPNPHLSVVYAHDLPANKARILLMLSLQHDHSVEFIKQAFNQY